MSTNKPETSTPVECALNDKLGIAQVVSWLGYDFLQVGGFTFAREGDVCRCSKIIDPRWTSENMREVANALNHAVLNATNPPRS